MIPWFMRDTVVYAPNWPGSLTVLVLLATVVDYLGREWKVGRGMKRQSARRVTHGGGGGGGLFVCFIA